MNHNIILQKPYKCKYLAGLFILDMSYITNSVNYDQSRRPETIQKYYGRHKSN